ncbi:carboxyl transferase domain protein [Mycobacterium kansasii]|uniref:Carboxyl transferase domain protein n=1 Tax=Mycobacterium kansasii TaxID=1768 RepID=A0A1V3WB15_MYCKA|nr:carboxyl transferase domain protein [Mycobacterium kansasii]
MGIVANQPPSSPAAWTSTPRRSRAIRADLRLLQHSHRDVRRCPGLLARHRPGIQRHHPPRRKLLYAYGEATVPKITVITRKAYGARTA